MMHQEPAPKQFLLVGESKLTRPWPRIRALIALVACSFASIGMAQETVHVGGYFFPPFVETRDEMTAGATIDLIKAFNGLQSDYLFVFRSTSPKRRYKDFANNHFDMIMFENMHWGWEDYPVDASRVYMKGGEVYVAYKREDRDQHFFDDLASRKIVGILGYHYQFANFNADEDFLTKNFQILLSNNHDRNIRLILLDRPELAEVAVITKSWLERFLASNESLRHKVLQSEKMDQKYEHSILLRNNHPSLKIDYINQLLDKADATGVLENIRQTYRIAE
jgi:ABC-type amino acid transport substrate-binding protein